MSPLPFNLAMDSIVREARESFQGGVQVEGSKVQFLLFADDLVLVPKMRRTSEVLKCSMK